MAAVIIKGCTDIPMQGVDHPGNAAQVWEVMSYGRVSCTCRHIMCTTMPKHSLEFLSIICVYVYSYTSLVCGMHLTRVNTSQL